MSYCRFQNTLNDLRDCKSALEELDEENDYEHTEETLASLSEDEQFAARRLISLCYDIIEEHGDTEGDGTIYGQDR